MEQETTRPHFLETEKNSALTLDLGGDGEVQAKVSVEPPFALQALPQRDSLAHVSLFCRVNR